MKSAERLQAFCELDLFFVEPTFVMIFLVPIPSKKTSVSYYIVSYDTILTQIA